MLSAGSIIVCPCLSICNQTFLIKKILSVSRIELYGSASSSSVVTTHEYLHEILPDLNTTFNECCF